MEKSILEYEVPDTGSRIGERDASTYDLSQHVKTAK